MDINKATAEELEQAFQVDGTRARYLIDHRTRSGPFRSWDDVKQVPGFEDKMVENLEQAGLTIGSGGQPAEGRTASAAPPEKPEGKGEQRENPPNRNGRLDLNSASAEELESVFQIDGTRARYLVEARKRVGSFRSWEQLKEEVPSFEDGMVRNLQEAGAHLGQS